VNQQQNAILMGDFNAHNIARACSISDAIGKRLFQSIENFNLIICNDEKPFCYNYQTRAIYPSIQSSLLQIYLSSTATSNRRSQQMLFPVTNDSASGCEGPKKAIIQL